LRQNQLGYTPLLLEQDEMAGKAVLTSEAAGMAEEGDVDGEKR
jgi:hypothetical protein